MATGAIPKIEVRTRRDESVWVLRRMVLNGTLPTGVRLGEVDLAQQLGVSRATVREALRQLVSEGTLTHEHYRGVRVAMPSDKALRDTADARSAIETVAAIHTARELQSDEDASRRLKEAVRRLKRSSREESVERHLEFHRLVHELSGSPLLERLWKVIEVQIALALRLDYAIQPSSDRLDRTHEEYLNALLSGDESSIKDEVERHVLFASHELLEMAQSGEAPPKETE